MTDIVERSKIQQGLLVVERWQDVKPYLEENRRLQSEFQRRRNTHIRQVAEVPNIVVEQWLKEGINIFDRNDAKKVQAKLNSNEYQYLRTSPGKCKVT